MKTITTNNAHSYPVEFVKCLNCSFLAFGYVEQKNILYGGDESEKSFHCRKNSPRIIYGSGDGWSGQLFPVIGNPEHFWCGDFQSE